MWAGEQEGYGVDCQAKFLAKKHAMRFPVHTSACPPKDEVPSCFPLPLHLTGAPRGTASLGSPGLLCAAGRGLPDMPPSHVSL